MRSGREHGLAGSATGRVERRRRRRLIALLCTITTIVALPAAAAHASTWQVGDVFANTPDGATAIKVFDNAGNFKEEFGSAGISGEGTGCAFNAGGDLYATFFQLNQTHRFANAHPHTDIQTISNPGTNESIVFDAAGNFYIGMADPNNGEFVRKYDPAGNLLDSYTNLATDRGADWIELAADQRTLFYDGEGQTVRRYDLATHTQLPDFATIPGGEAFALRLLPPGDGSGGLLVADGDDIKRLDGAGNVVQNYDAPNTSLWFALNRDPNGTSFWSADLFSGKVFRFNIASGAVEVGPIQAHPSEVAGLCVFGESTAAVPTTPPQTPVAAPAKTPGKCNGTEATIVGTRASETIKGTPKADVIQGWDGKDQIMGLGGNDLICGANGRDTIKGGGGKDTLIGGAGPDKLIGGPGKDRVFGGTPGAPPQNAKDTCVGGGDALKNCENRQNG